MCISGKWSSRQREKPVQRPFGRTAPGMLEGTEGATELERRIRRGEAKGRTDASEGPHLFSEPPEPTTRLPISRNCTPPILQLLKPGSASQPSILVSPITKPFPPLKNRLNPFLLLSSLLQPLSRIIQCPHHSPGFRHRLRCSVIEKTHIQMMPLSKPFQNLMAVELYTPSCGLRHLPSPPPQRRPSPSLPGSPLTRLLTPASSLSPAPVLFPSSGPVHVVSSACKALPSSSLGRSLRILWTSAETLPPCRGRC